MEATTEEVSRKSPYQVLSDEFGLKLMRFAGARFVKILGKRETGSVGHRVMQIWEITVDKETKTVDIVCDGTPVLQIKGSHNGILERIAVRSLITNFTERRRAMGGGGGRNSLPQAASRSSSLQIRQSQSTDV